MDGQNKVGQSESPRGWMDYLPAGLKRLVARYNSREVSPADVTETAMQHPGPGQVNEAPGGLRAHRRIETDSSSITSSEASDVVGTFAENFTELLEDAAWNNVDQRSNLQDRDSGVEMEMEMNPVPGPESSLNLFLREFEPAELPEDWSIALLLKDYDVVNTKELDDLVCSKLQSGLAKLSGLDRATWATLSAEQKTGYIDHIRELAYIFQQLPPQELVDSLIRDSHSMETPQRLGHLEAWLNWMTRTHVNLSDLLNRDEPVLHSLYSLLKTFRTPLQQLKMDCLKGCHTASEPSLERCNRMAAGDPGTLNADGTAAQFDTDILRNSNFAIFDRNGQLQFHSAVRNHERQLNEAGDEVAVCDSRYMEDCRRALIELCQDAPKEMLAVVTDIVTQSPYNPLFNTLNDLCSEKIEPGYILAPQKRRTETRLRPNDDGTLSIKLTLAFNQYKLTAPDCNQYVVDQPVLITSTMTIDPQQVASRRLGPVKLTLLQASDCRHL